MHAAPQTGSHSLGKKPPLTAFVEFHVLALPDIILPLL